MVDRQKRTRPLVAYAFVLVFLLLAATVGGGVYLYYSHFETHYRVEVGSQLSAIGQLKTNDLADWRHERLADASLLYGNVAFAALAKRYLGDPSDAQAEQELQSWLQSYETDDRYDQVRLLDTRGATRVPTPAGIPPVSSAISEHLTGVLQSGQVTFLDFYRDDDDGRAYLAVLVPIPYGGRSYQALGAVLLRIDPATYLYPYIARWPTPSETAETLLVRRDGNDVLFLNELRFRKDTALSLRIPLSSQDVPAVKAILGREGIVEGLDYRGVRVIADVRSVPNSPWFLVARMDAAEVDAPLRERLWQIAAFVGVALVGTGASLALLWRHREAGLYRERAEVAEALRESEEKRLLVVDNASEVIVVLQDGMLRLVNPTLVATLGFSEQELESTPFSAFVHPDDRAMVVDRHQKRMRGEAVPARYEFRLLTKDGNARWIEANAVQIEWEGRPATLGLLDDITERKQSQAILSESELKYRQVVENAGEAVYVAQGGKIVFLNPATSTAFGRSAEDLTGKPFADFVHPDDRGRVLGYHQARARGEEAPSVHAFRIVREAGDVRWTEVRVVRVDWLGKPASLCLMTDITEHKRAEDELRESEDRYRSLVDNVPGVIFTMDLAGKITFVSRRIKETLGYETAEVINKSVLDLIPEEERQRAMQSIQRGMTGVGIKHFETPMIKKSGERVWLECSFARVRKDGAVIGAQGTVVDITERKRAEEEIKSQLEELQRWEAVMLDREDRVREIKREVNELCRRVGEGIRYTSEEAQ
jgi:PAS domain S-box-containing protein